MTSVTKLLLTIPRLQTQLPLLNLKPWTLILTVISLAMLKKEVSTPSQCCPSFPSQCPETLTRIYSTSLPLRFVCTELNLLRVPLQAKRAF
jgi:hypothetical protein